MLSPSARASTKQVLLLGTDRVLSRLEWTWVRAAGGLARINEGKNVNNVSGRTKPERLRESRLSDVLWPRTLEAIDAGVEPSELAQVINDVSRRTGEKVADTLTKRAPQMHREHRAIARGMHRRMRAIWGPAFDAFYEVWVCAEEIGSDLQQLHSHEDDPLVAALLGLHARACLVFAETHALMLQGYPFGALARTRSLHETAVLSTVLSTFGREPGMEDLGERFVNHAAIDRLKDLELAARNGLEIDNHELEAAQKHRDELVAIYGPMYAKDYGWARPVDPNLGPNGHLTFARLEDLVDSGLERLNYRIGGHQVHSSAWSVVSNAVPRGDAVYRITGPINIAFGEPAALALAGIVSSLAAIVYGVAPLPEPMDLVGLEAIDVLSDRAMQLFAEAQARVDEREHRLQRRLRSGTTARDDERVARLH